MKKRIAIALCLMIGLTMILFSGCGSKSGDVGAGNEKNGKITIVATLFPQYDFARQIAGDKADVKLLLPPGMESHSYEPTPSEIITITNSDLFIYTGEYMEAWAQSIIEGMQDSDAVVLDVSSGIDLAKTSDIEEQHGDEAKETEAEEHLYDPHIWTDPLMAKEMVNNIVNTLCEVDPDNSSYYQKNGESYNKELDKLDAEFRDIVENGKRNEIIFGSKFALYYFAREYDLDYKAAFDSCAAETEPSVKTVAHLITEIKEENIPVIYYAEIDEPKVAKSISEETGAKMLLFHSCHNVTRDEMDSGATYLSLMKQNAKNLKEGLN